MLFRFNFVVDFERVRKFELTYLHFRLFSLESYFVKLCCSTILYRVKCYCSFTSVTKTIICPDYQQYTEFIHKRLEFNVHNVKFQVYCATETKFSRITENFAV